MDWCGVFSSSSLVKGSTRSYLVESKHDVKCRRVLRIISRRIYSCRRRESVRRRDSSSGVESSSSKQTRESSTEESLTNETEFSPEKLALPDLQQTLSKFSVKHSKKHIRSRQPQKNNLVMNKSSIGRHRLIKRRYSVPETVMRKHKLHETAAKSKSVDVCATSTNSVSSACHNTYPTENKLKDESCQTDSIKYVSSRGPKRTHISSKCRRRDGSCVRCFKKYASYCQYRQRAQHDRHYQPMSQSDFELPPIDNNYRTMPDHLSKSNSDWSLTDSNSDARVFSAHSYPPRSFPFSTHQSRPSLEDETSNSMKNIRSTTSQQSLPQAKNEFEPCPRLTGVNKFADPSADCRGNSAVDQTPHQDDDFNGADADLFPITFHSESVFLRPYEKGGFLSHKELHHVSIKVVPDVNTTFESFPTTNASSTEKFHTEVNLDVNEDGHAETKPPKRVPSPTPAVETVLNRPATTSNSTPPPSYPDCSVPIDDYPLKLHAAEPSKLQIHVDITNVDLSDSFYKLINDSNDNNGDSIAHHQSRVRLASGKYNSKTAWNFLFQKLRDSYPKRPFLKLPSLQQPQTGGVYYSNLPDAVAAVPNETETRSVPQPDEASSDSDASIADSLEDVQTYAKSNSYNKHDARLARGEVNLDVDERYERKMAQKGGGIAYFLPLEMPLEPRANDRFTPIKMPDLLETKLKSRQRCLPKHDSCFSNRFKKTQTSGKNVSRRKTSRYKKHECDGKPLSSRKQPTVTTRKTGSKLDEEIMNVLLDGLKVEDGGDNSKQTAKMTATRSVQTDRQAAESNANRVVNNYMETIKISSPAEETSAHEGDVYEVLQSEEETARINSTDYYRSVKKCRKIYCPTKKTFQSNSASEGAKYVRKFDDNQDAGRVTNTFRNLRGVKKPSKNRFRGGQTMRLASCRFRPFCQQFEAIPEEMTNVSQEKATNREPAVGESLTSDDCKSSTESKTEQVDRIEAAQVDSNGYTTASETYVNEYKQMKEEAKSHKGRDSLLLVNKHEELITLSKGWINFYLLNGNANADGVNVDEEDVCDEETPRRSPLYTVHVHAKPEIQAQNTPPQTAAAGAVLPDICSSSPKFNDQKAACTRSKLSNGTNLPGITNRSPQTVQSAVSSQKTRDHVLPKLDSNCWDEHTDEFRENGERASKNDNRGLESMAQYEPVSAFDSLDSDKAASTTITSSNQSENSIDEIRPCKKGRYKKLQKYHRPRTRQYDPIKRDNRWSLTIEGSEQGDRRPVAPNIEMQLSLKNNRSSTRSNQSWKFSITNEDTSRTNDIEEYETNSRYLPHLNVNCKVPFPICYGDENINCGKNSRSSSALSLQGRSTRSIVETCSDRISRFDSDLRLHIRKSEEDLTVVGSTITPERKPRVPTMSERDLYRMKLIKQ